MVTSTPAARAASVAVTVTAAARPSRRPWKGRPAARPDLSRPVLSRPVLGRAGRAAGPGGIPGAP